MKSCSPLGKSKDSLKILKFVLSQPDSPVVDTLTPGLVHYQLDKALVC